MFLLDNCNIDLIFSSPFIRTLQTIYPFATSKKLSINGIIMCEDPVSTPHLYGALYAMEKFLTSEEGRNKYLKLFKKNHYFLIKIK